MKIGDLVVFKGSINYMKNMPLAIVIDESNSDSEYHRRIKVMWIGEEIPIQAKVLSTTGSRFSGWCSPNKFEVVNEKNI